ncbi:hypothetical protein VNO77_34484 [Canavalia gladiata]|uniref:Uncharacterized protein n=1 Tax=Canavalia gladiata TaxID=3824 RepID=A0AAN9PZA2_CANGL
MGRGKVARPKGSQSKGSTHGCNAIMQVEMKSSWENELDLKLVRLKEVNPQHAHMAATSLHNWRCKIQGKKEVQHEDFSGGHPS